MPTWLNYSTRHVPGTGQCADKYLLVIGTPTVPDVWQAKLQAKPTVKQLCYDGDLTSLSVFFNFKDYPRSRALVRAYSNVVEDILSDPHSGHVSISMLSSLAILSF